MYPKGCLGVWVPKVPFTTFTSHAYLYDTNSMRGGRRYVHLAALYRLSPTVSAAHAGIKTWTTVKAELTHINFLRQSTKRMARSKN